MSEACLICDGRSFSEVFKVGKFPLVIGAVPAEHKDVREFPLEIAVCRRCSLVQQVKRLDKEAVDLLYSAEYYSCPSPLLTGMGAAEIDKYFDFLISCGLPKGKLLEIACFDGYLLTKLAAAGWDVHGIDPAGQTRIAVEKFGPERIRREFFGAKSYPPGEFDAVVARNFLEHLFDLHEFLESVSACLRPGGRLFIEVPNVNTTLDLGVFGSFFHQHVSYFSKETMTLVLDMHGFAVEHCSETNLLLLGARKTGKPAWRYLGKNGEKAPSGGELARVERFIENSARMRGRILAVFDDPATPRVALFGASAISTMIVSLLSPARIAKLRFILDNDKLKAGKFIHGCPVPISSPEGLKNRDIDALIIASYQFEREIKKQLLAAGLEEGKIRPLFGT